MSFLNKIRNTVNPTTIDDFKSTIGKHAGLARQNRETELSYVRNVTEIIWNEAPAS